MKAAQINDYGDVNQLQIVEIPTPQPTEDQVLVEVHASSINPADNGMRQGNIKDFFPFTFPVTLGGDIAGVVRVVGKGVTGWHVGDKVYGQAYALFGDSGAYAEEAAVAADHIARIPAGVDMSIAGSLPLIGVSAVQAIREHATLQSGQKILIHGGAGGVGALAVQLAKHTGAHVAVTVSPKDIGFAKSLGADTVIDYTSQDFGALLHDYDTVIDLVADPTASGGVFERSLDVLKPGGTMVSLVAFNAAEALQKAKDRGINAVYQLTRVTTDSLNQLTRLIETGVLTPRVARTYPLEAIRDAFTAHETEKPGKIVITMHT